MFHQKSSSISQESDEFFEHQKTFLTTYNAKIKDATGAADKSTRTHKGKTFFKVNRMARNPIFSCC